MKKIVIASFLLASFLFSNAQVDDRTLILSLMPQIGFPVGEVKKTNGIILGGHFQVEKQITNNSRILLQFGGGMLQGKKYDTEWGYEDSYPAIALTQLRGGAKYFMGQHIFIAGMAGAAQSNAEGKKSIGFSYAPVIGYEFLIGGNSDVNLRYDISTFNGYKVELATFSIGYHF